MKITAIDTVVVHAEMRNWVFVKLSTDEGLVGWGESTVEWKTRAVVGCIEDYRTLLVGEDPRRVEHIWQMMYRQHFFRPGMVECSAMSGIEHACWDIAGKALGAPVHQLLGGAVRDTVRLYDHLGGGEMVSVYHTLSPEEAREKIRDGRAGTPNDGADHDRRAALHAPPVPRTARARRLLGAAAGRGALRRHLRAAPDRGHGRGVPRRARPALERDRLREHVEAPRNVRTLGLEVRRREGDVHRGRVAGGPVDEGSTA